MNVYEFMLELGCNYHTFIVYGNSKEECAKKIAQKIEIDAKNPPTKFDFNSDGFDYQKYRKKMIKIYKDRAIKNDENNHMLSFWNENDEIWKYVLSKMVEKNPDNVIAVYNREYR